MLLPCAKFLSRKNLQTVKEAEKIYSKFEEKFVMGNIKSYDSWKDSMAKEFKRLKWKVHHHGAEKYIAIKNDIVVKWDGDCAFESYHPVIDEILCYSKLKKKRLQKYTPKIYAFHYNMVAEERVDIPKDYDEKDKVLNKLYKIFNKKNISVGDFHSDNIGIKDNIPKVIDYVY